MQCCGYANGGPVVLGICLGAVAAQKKPPQIRRLAADNRKQLWVCATLPDKALPGEVNPYIRCENEDSFPDLLSTGKFQKFAI